MTKKWRAKQNYSRSDLEKLMRKNGFVQSNDYSDRSAKYLDAMEAGILRQKWQKRRKYTNMNKG